MDRADERLLTHLKNHNEERRQELLTYLGSGTPKDYAEYREVVGVVRGLLHANQYIEDLLDRTKGDEDE